MSAAALIDTLSVENCGQPHHFGQLREDVCEKFEEGNFSALSLELQKTIVLNTLVRNEVTIYEKLNIANIWNWRMPIAEISTDLNPQFPVICRDDGSTSCIYDSWFAIGGIDNSFEYHNQTFVPEDSTVHVLYGYELGVPPEMGRPGQHSCGSRPKVFIPSGGNHCGFRFSSVDVTENHLYLDGALQSQDDRHLPYADAVASSTLTADLNVRNHITVTVYDWEADGHCGIETTRYICRESSTYEYIEEQSITESWEVVQPSSYGQAYSFQVKDPDSSPLVTFTTDIPEYKLQLGGSSLQNSKYRYDVGYRYPPYNYLYVQRRDSPFILVSDLLLQDDDNDTVQFKADSSYLDDCTLSILDPYGEHTIPCSQNQPVTYTPKLNATLNESIYDKGDRMMLTVAASRDGGPAVGQVTVEYGGNVTNLALVDGEAEIILDQIPDDEIITVQFEDQRRVLHLAVYNSRLYWSIAWLAVSLSVMYLLFKGVSREILRRSL
ncbi:hypothetical protein COV20_03675 [Candidatus Woesearchaeota archaeon CG10_big_fil_rev_8_21_14_0_10_45_16]|nr:MAG: hypothetical protein COV20_03675 [Candidatus Woesearchaeota archaeon CG10_big_fil_rev_8_21_14_0_10_45_16]